MASADKSKGRGIAIGGMIAGAVAGAAVALVYTPYSGEELRRRILGWANSRGDDVRAKARQAAGQAQSKAQQAVQQAQSQAQQALEQAQTQAQALTNRGET